jgi:hypothetical protein
LTRALGLSTSWEFPGLCNAEEKVGVRTHPIDRDKLTADLDTILSASRFFTAQFHNEQKAPELSPGHPHAFVDNLLTNFDVGALQRQEIEQWRGFPRGAFGYNEGPTSSCHTFCWKARQSFDVPFF